MAFIFPQATVKILRNIYRNPARRKLPYLPIAVRYLHTTPYRAQREDDRFPAQANGATPSITSTIDDLDPELRAALESLSPEEQAEFRQAMAEVEYMSSPEAQADLKEEASLTANDFMDKIPYMESPPRVRTDKLGFMAEGEDDAEDIGEDPEYEADDITSLAHGELEQHRELRKYARLAVWEMPLLHKLAKPFELPTADTPLRFRMTTYLGEKHPAAKKVVCQFSTKDIAKAAELTEPQRIKLIKLVGVRYNPDTDTVKMSSEIHETMAQNQRYLADLVQTLIKEAKDPKDMFEDIPLDFRHHRPKKQWYFPEEWKLDQARRQALVAERERVRQIEAEKQESGQLVKGRELLEQALKTMPSQMPRLAADSRKRMLRDR